MSNTVAIYPFPVADSKLVESVNEQIRKLEKAIKQHQVLLGLKDTDRMDWIQKNPGALIHHNGGYWITRYANKWFPTAREAIDAAIMAENNAG